MARLPSNDYLIQRIGEYVILFQDGTEEEVVRFDPSQGQEVLEALTGIDRSQLERQDKIHATLWCGYFYALAAHERQAVNLTVLIPQPGKENT